MRSPYANQAMGNSRPRDRLGGLMAAGELGLGRAVDALHLEARERHRPPLVRDVDQPEERWRPRLELGHVLVGQSSTRRPRSGKGTGIAVWVGVMKGGLQSSPETNVGFDMSAMSRITKPPCQ